MLGAQSVSHSTGTSAETTAPLADISASTISWSKRAHCPLVDQTHLKFVNVTYSGSVDLLLQSRIQML